MSRQRFNWWPFALNMIRDYPERKKAMENLCSQDQREYEAVKKAVELTEVMPEGRVRIRLVELTMWKRTNTIAGSSVLLNISEGTAKRYRWQFVLLVGYTYGFLSAEEYISLVKRKTEKKNGTLID